MGLKEDKTITDIVQAVKESDAKKTKGYDTQATVTRVEDGKAWVHIPGGVTETPAELTINAQPGDIVMVRVAGGRAFLLGNATNPPTDDATAKEALSNANDALQSAVNARRAADSAEASAATASAAAQDAVETAEAVHGIAIQAQEDAETAKTNAQTAITNAAAAASAASQAQTDATAAGSAAAAAQTSANAAGQAASRAQAAAEAAQGDIDEQQEYFWHDALGAHVLSDTDEVTGKRYRTDLKGAGQEIFELDGTTETSVASFGADGARLGETGGAHSVIDENGQRFYASNGRTLLANIGYGATQEAGQKNPYYTFGFRNPSSAIGSYSVAEGGGVTASGTDSHAEGNLTVASEACAHAEGLQTTASGTASHVEGRETTASGENSHAQNEGTIAAHENQTVIGKYNDNQQKNAFEIGNGTGHASRSNAFSVDWDGNVEASGDIEDGSGNVLRDKADSSDLADYLPLTGGTLTGALSGTDATMSGNITSKTAKLDISNYQIAGNVDKTIYDALNSLGWLSDCVES